MREAGSGSGSRGSHHGAGSHRIASELGTSYIGNPHEVPNLLAYLLLPPYYLTPEPLSVCLTSLLPGRELNTYLGPPILPKLPTYIYLSIHLPPPGCCLCPSCLSFCHSISERLPKSRGAGALCVCILFRFLAGLGWAVVVPRPCCGFERCSSFSSFFFSYGMW